MGWSPKQSALNFFEISLKSYILSQILIWLFYSTQHIFGFFLSFNVKTVIFLKNFLNTIEAPENCLICILLLSLCTLPHNAPSLRSWVPGEWVQNFGIYFKALVKLLLPSSWPHFCHALPDSLHDSHPDLPPLGVFAYAVPLAWESLLSLPESPRHTWQSSVHPPGFTPFMVAVNLLHPNHLQAGMSCSTKLSAVAHHFCHHIRCPV